MTPASPMQLALIESLPEDAPLSRILQVALLDERVSAEKLSGLLDVQERVEQRNAVREFNAAFARLQPKLPRIVKKGKVEMGAKGSIAFARYEDIDEKIRPLMTEEGFSVAFASNDSDHGILLTATLVHLAGHSITSSLRLPADKGPGRNDLQALGSSLTYAKRYLLCGLLNIVTVGEDDDATAGDFLNEREAAAIEDILHEIGEQHRPKFLEYVGFKAVPEIHRAAYRAAINYLVAKRRQIGEKAK